MDSRAAKFSGAVGFLDSGQLGDGHSVAEFHGVESDLADFIDHFLAFGVA